MTDPDTTAKGMSVTRTGQQGAFGGELLTVNFGPHHPSTHGVLRLIVDLDGEQIKRVKPVIGYLHTGIEKQAEALRWQQAVVVTDRHDYLSPPINNLAYALAVERLMGVDVPPRAKGLRVIMSEPTRLSSHLVWLGTSGIELGAMSMLMYCFRERDTILNMNEEISGYRMHTSYIRPGGVFADATPRFFELLNDFIEKMPGHIDEYEDLLTMNPIFRSRTIGIGILSGANAKVLGATGPMLRTHPTTPPHPNTPPPHPTTTPPQPPHTPPPPHPPPPHPPTPPPPHTHHTPPTPPTH